MLTINILNNEITVGMELSSEYSSYYTIHSISFRTEEMDSFVELETGLNIINYTTTITLDRLAQLATPILLDSFEDHLIMVKVNLRANDGTVPCMRSEFMAYNVPKCRLYNVLKKSLFNIKPNCQEGINSINLLLEYQMLELALSLGKTDKAIQLYNKLYNNRNTSTTTNICNCNGSV